MKKYDLLRNAYGAYFKYKLSHYKQYGSDHDIFSQYELADLLNIDEQLFASWIKAFEDKFYFGTCEPVKDNRPLAAHMYNDSSTGTTSKKLSDIESGKESNLLFKLLGITTRTNFFLDKAAISLKFVYSPEWIETFVYSDDFEGLHIRTGKIARGGIRHVTEITELYNEIYNLAITQVIKNASVVPTGGKGGFVLKSDIEIKDAYLLFAESILDITDNIQNNQIVHPVKWYDFDDPYFVFAPDKGTGTFSSIANKIAEKYNFWMHDAFASGDTYNHKTIGITALGAFESTKNHLRAIDIIPEQQPFSVIGIGDMSGDVFGNFMMLSDNIVLKAAFDHRNIIIDPMPHPSAINERKKLFAQHHSSWEDYDKTLLSGEVFKRDADHVYLTPSVREFLNTQESTLTPDDIIKILLRHNSDVLFFGGIGTYVCASDEEIGYDVKNKHLRIKASELRAKIITEGANLACTHKARIEFALNGGLINTDSLDNAGGVQCSDYEVNIKLMFRESSNKYPLMTQALPRIVNQITSSIALHNIMVNLSCGLITKDMYEKFLPSLGLKHNICTRPEIIVLFSHGKMLLKKYIITYKNQFAKDYFMPLIGEYNFEIHPLYDQIGAAFIANEIMDHLGPWLLYQGSIETIFKTYLIARSELLPLYNGFNNISSFNDHKELYRHIREIFIATMKTL